MKYLIISILLIWSNAILGQADTLFSDFLKTFHPQQEIDPKYLVKFFDYEENGLETRMIYEKRSTKQILRKGDDYILLTIKYDCPAGGFCSAVELYSFTYDGILISNIDLDQSYGDCSFHNNTLTILMEEEIIVTLDEKWEGDCEEESTEEESKIVNEYIITPDGEIVLTKNKEIANGREFKEISLSVFNEFDLLKYSKKDLAKMRNELFASYGYSFKSSKWSNYFAQFHWYQANQESVDESQLTEIERRNLKLVLEAEKI